MLHARLIGAVAIAGFAAVSMAPGAMAQAAKPAAKAAAAKPAATKVAAKAAPKATIVTGKIASIDAPLQFVTLADGRTFRIKDAAKFKAMKVGGTVKLSVAAPTSA